MGIQMDRLGDLLYSIRAALQLASSQHLLRRNNHRNSLMREKPEAQPQLGDFGDCFRFVLFLLLAHSFFILAPTVSSF